MSRDTRQRILDAARELFNERGYNGVSLQDIADVLGISKGNLTYHFRRKEEIMESLVAGEEDTFPVRTPRTLEELDEDFADMQGAVQRNLYFFRYHAQLSQTSQEICRRQQARYQELLRRFQEAFQSLREAGLLREEAFDGEYRHIIDLLYMSAVYWAPFQALKASQLPVPEGSRHPRPRRRAEEAAAGAGHPRPQRQAAGAGEPRPQRQTAGAGEPSCRGRRREQGSPGRRGRREGDSGLPPPCVADRLLPSDGKGTGSALDGRPAGAYIRLHQRGERLEHIAHQLQPKLLMADGFIRDGAALLQGGLIVGEDCRDACCAVQVDRAFKVVVEAAVIQVDRAHHGFRPSLTKTFAWTKPGVYS